MRWSIRLCSIVIACCLFITLLISSAEYAIYARPQFYAHTFQKYGVCEYADMELSEVLKVSNYLIAYLRGNEDSLAQFTAVVGGEERLFYSEREILHMKDVRTLFIGALWIRRASILLGLLLLGILIWKKQDFIRTFVRSIVGTFGALLSAAAVLALLISSNFSRAFTAFHKLFFSNSLWLLDPEEDWVIRLLPEEFFLSMCIAIAVTFTISVLCVLVLCAAYLMFRKRRA